MAKSIFCFVAITALLMFTACQSGEQEQAETESPKPSHPELSQLVQWMTGSFSSQAQSQADSNFFDIRLEMVPIWSEGSQGAWLYVEQAAASSLDKPYRQRVYHVVNPYKGIYRSDVYTLPEPERFIGAWKTPEKFDALTTDSLGSRSGCSIVMTWKDGAFVGGTEGDGCESTLRGATYATSEVTIKADGLYTWDQGFDADGIQVWGAETGGYEFKRVDVN